MPNLKYLLCGFRFFNPLESLNLNLLKEINRELKLRAPQIKTVFLTNQILWWAHNLICQKIESILFKSAFNCILKSEDDTQSLLALSVKHGKTPCYYSQYINTGDRPTKEIDFIST